MRPQDIINISPAAFGEETSGRGRQFVELLRLIEAHCPDLRWYVADVQTVGPSPMEWRSAIPTFVGNTEALIEAASGVDQFESGVFVGITKSLDCPRFRTGGLWTEDEEQASLGDAIVEVRAFDTTYWTIASSDTSIVDGLRTRFWQNCPSKGHK